MKRIAIVLFVLFTLVMSASAIAEKSKINEIQTSIELPSGERVKNIFTSCNSLKCFHTIISIPVECKKHPCVFSVRTFEVATGKIVSERKIIER